MYGCMKKTLNSCMFFYHALKLYYRVPNKHPLLI